MLQIDVFAIDKFINLCRANSVAYCVFPRGVPELKQDCGNALSTGKPWVALVTSARLREVQLELHTFKYPFVVLGYAPNVVILGSISASNIFPMTVAEEDDGAFVKFNQRWQSMQESLEMQYVEYWLEKSKTVTEACRNMRYSRSTLYRKIELWWCTEGEGAAAWLAKRMK